MLPAEKSKEISSDVASTSKKAAGTAADYVKQAAAKTKETATKMVAKLSKARRSG